MNSVFASAGDAVRRWFQPASKITPPNEKEEKVIQQRFEQEEIETEFLRAPRAKRARIQTNEFPTETNESLNDKASDRDHTINSVEKSDAVANIDTKNDTNNHMKNDAKNETQKRVVSIQERTLPDVAFHFVDSSSDVNEPPRSIVDFSCSFKIPNCCFVCTQLLIPHSLSKTRRASSRKRRVVDTETLATEGARAASQSGVKEQANAFGEQENAVPEQDLRPICDRHWQEEMSQNSSIDYAFFVIRKLYLAANANDNEPSEKEAFASFRRICKACFERAIVSSVIDRPNSLVRSIFLRDLRVRCPLCPADSEATLLDRQRVLPLISTKERRLAVVKAWDREVFVRENHIFHCPIAGCAFSVLVKKSDVQEGKAAISDRIVCSEHGSHCTKCWNAITDASAHRCRGLPDELVSPKCRISTHLRRCTTCQLPIENNGGCDSMTCTCGRSFCWKTAQNAKQKPVLRKIRKNVDK